MKHPHSAANLLTPREVASWVNSIEGLDGVTFSGGEPFEQAEAVSSTIDAIRESGSSQLPVFVYSGFTLDEIKQSDSEHVEQLLSSVDLLCAGRYEHTLYDPTLLWRGSSNQELHFLSSAYSADSVAHWMEESPVEEYEVSLSEIQFTGFGGPGSSLLQEVRRQLSGVR